MGPMAQLLPVSGDDDGSQKLAEGEMKEQQSTTCNSASTSNGNSIPPRKWWQCCSTVAAQCAMVSGNMNISKSNIKQQ